MDVNIKWDEVCWAPIIVIFLEEDILAIYSLKYIYSLIHLQTCQHAQQLIKYKWLLIDMNTGFFTTMER